VMPLELASKLFLVLIFALTGGGAVWLNRVATGAWRFWPLLGFLLLYNRVFLWGFLNYLFGIGMALCGVAMWLALERRAWWLRVGASSIVALVCYFSHLAAFGFYVLVILGVELPVAFAECRARRWPSLARRFSVGGAQFVVPAVLVLGYWRQTPLGEVSYADFWRKGDLLFSVFDNYSRALDIASFAAFLGLLGWLAWTRRLWLVPRLGWALSILLAVYLLLPSQLYGGSGADHRLPVAVFLLLVAASAPRFSSRRTAVLIGLGAASMLMARLAVIEGVWLHADGVYSADLAALDALPSGAKLGIGIPADAIHLVPVPEVHLAALAVVRREAFVPTLFAYPGQQPIAFVPAYAALAEAATPQRLWTVSTSREATAMGQVLPVLQQYDYILLTGGRLVDVPFNRCLRRFSGQPSFQIFTVIHDPDCVVPDG